MQRLEKGKEKEKKRYGYRILTLSSSDIEYVENKRKSDPTFLLKVSIFIYNYFRVVR